MLCSAGGLKLVWRTRPRSQDVESLLEKLWKMFFAPRPLHSCHGARACCRAALAPAKPNPHGVCRHSSISGWWYIGPLASLSLNHVLTTAINTLLQTTRVLTLFGSDTDGGSTNQGPAQPAEEGTGGIGQAGGQLHHHRGIKELGKCGGGNLSPGRSLYGSMHNGNILEYKSPV